MSVLFWLSAVGLFYIYAGYPLLIMALARWRPRPVRRGPGAVRFSVVIAAHNEAANLRSKIESILASDCADRLEEILVGSDGSSDRTAEIVAELGNPRVRCVAFDRRRGKPAVLNDVVPMCRSEIVVLTDARQPVEPTAIVRLLSVLDDPEVGVVSGELVFRAADGSAVRRRGRVLVLREGDPETRGAVRVRAGRHRRALCDPAAAFPADSAGYPAGRCGDPDAGGCPGVDRKSVV